MSFQDNLVVFAKQEYSFLCSEYGFYQPIVSNEGYTTTIDFLENDLAIELEFEWREFCVFLMVVRLTDGKLPEGYYTYLGKKVRLPLMHLIEKYKWHVETDLIEEIKRIGRKKRTDLEPDDLRSQVSLYKKLLRFCIKNILEEGVYLFDK